MASGTTQYESSCFRSTCHLLIAPFYSILAGPMLRIVAGREKENLFVHENALLFSSSLQLRALVNGSWKESDGMIDWSHTDSEIVKIVITYLYTGSYEFPEPDVFDIPGIPNALSIEGIPETDDENVIGVPAIGLDEVQAEESPPRVAGKEA